MAALPSARSAVSTEHHNATGGARETGRNKKPHCLWGRPCASIRLTDNRDTGGETIMPKLRHIALACKDLQKTAKFYEEAFGMHRVRESKVAVMLSDGVVSLALLDLHANNNTPEEIADDYVGLHHMGFMVDSVPEAANVVEKAGGIYCGQIKNVGAGADYERKYRDPNGVVIDVTGPEHVASSWKVPFESDA
jgi:catechol 2,3-dioxygenase-like lactoylglutathione lyase family enzyme